MTEQLLRPLSNRDKYNPWDVVRTVDGEEYYTRVEIPTHGTGKKVSLGIGDFVKIVPRDKPRGKVAAVGQVCSLYQRHSKEVVITYAPKGLVNLVCEVRLLVRPGDTATGAWLKRLLNANMSFFSMPARKPYHGDAELVALAGAFLECPLGELSEEGSNGNGKGNTPHIELGKVTVESMETFMARSVFVESSFYCREKEVLVPVENADGTVSMNSRIEPITGKDVTEAIFCVSMSPRNRALYERKVVPQKRKNVIDDDDEEDENENKVIETKRRKCVIDDDSDEDDDNNKYVQGSKCSNTREESTLEEDDIFEDVVSGEVSVEKKAKTESKKTVSKKEKKSAKTERMKTDRLDSPEVLQESSHSILTISSSSSSSSSSSPSPKPAEKKAERKNGGNSFEKYINQLNSNMDSTSPSSSLSSSRSQTPKKQKKISKLVPLKVEEDPSSTTQKPAFESPASLWKKMNSVRQSRIGMFFQKIDTNGNSNSAQNLIGRFNEAGKAEHTESKMSTSSISSADMGSSSGFLDEKDSDESDLDDFIVGDDDTVEYYEKSKDGLESSDEEKDSNTEEEEDDDNEEKKKPKKKKRLNSAVLSSDESGSESEGRGERRGNSVHPSVLCSPGRVHQLFTLRQAYSVYIQFIASACLDPDFVSSTDNKKDRDYFGAACQKVERELLTKKECLVSSSVWKLGLFRDIKSRPIFVSYQRASTIDHNCDACSRMGQENMYIVKLRGNAYDSDALWENETVYEIDPDEVYGCSGGRGGYEDEDEDEDQYDDDDQRAVESDYEDGDGINRDDFDNEEAAWKAKRKNFYVLGKTCHMKTKLYHKLHHYKLELVASVKRKIASIKEMGCEDEGDILTTLLDDAGWCSSVNINHASKLVYAHFQFS